MNDRLDRLNEIKGLGTPSCGHGAGCPFDWLTQLALQRTLGIGDLRNNQSQDQKCVFCDKSFTSTTLLSRLNSRKFVAAYLDAECGIKAGFLKPQIYHASNKGNLRIKSPNILNHL